MDLFIYTVGSLTPLFEKLGPWLETVNRSLSGRDYGGPMENLWIEVEVHEYSMNVPDKPPWSFRFQKLVGPRPFDGLGPFKPSRNVGHYGVRPTADDMRGNSTVV